MATYEDLLETCNNQQQTIKDLTEKIKELEERHNYGQFQLTTRPNINVPIQKGLPVITLPIPSSENMYSSLSVDEYCTDEEELEKEFPVMSNQKKRRRTKTKTPPKLISKGEDKNKQNKEKKALPPPPINVSNVKDFKLLRDNILLQVNDQVQFKALSNSDIKITVQNEDDYRKIKTMLNDIKAKGTEENSNNPLNSLNEIQYHTYQLKSDRLYRVVIRGLPASIDTPDIKSAIEEKGHQVKNVLNIQKKTIVNGDKVIKHFPLFYVDITQKDNNKDVYKITELLHCKVKVEPPNKVRDIPQCTNCQQLGHTKNFCVRQARCVKCAGAHHYKECKKQLGSAPTCALCNQKGHTANYKGCVVYKSKLNAHHPQKVTVVRRLQNKSDEKRNTIEPSTSGLTYAQVSKKASGTQNQDKKEKKNEPTISNLMEMLSQFQTEIKHSLGQLIERVEKLENKSKPQNKQVKKNQNV